MVKTNKYVYLKCISCEKQKYLKLEAYLKLAEGKDQQAFDESFEATFKCPTCKKQAL